MKKMNRMSLKLSLILTVLSAACAEAVIINWGNSSLVPAASQFSNGSVVGNGQASFALGTFDAGFTPTAANIGSWGANFNIFEVVNIQNNKFVGSANLANNVTFSAGEQFFMLAINGSFDQSAGAVDVIPFSATQFFLGSSQQGPTVPVVNNFLVPNAAAPQNGTDIQYYTESPSFFTIVGSAQPNGSVTFGSPLQVPEPSGVVLMAFSAAGVLLRRRRA